MSCLFCKVVVGHVNITLEENRLNPSNVPGIIIDHNLQAKIAYSGSNQREFRFISYQGGVGGIRISMSKELSITVSNGLPSKNMKRGKQIFNYNSTIPQRQRLTQCVAGTQKQLRMGLGPKLFSGPASSDRKK